MGAFSMPTLSGSPSPTFSGPAATALPSSGGSSSSSGAPTLYAGGTNATGMQMPVSNTGPGMTNTAMPAAPTNKLQPALPVPGQGALSPLSSPLATPASPLAAPNGLTASQNPAAATSPTSAPGTTSPTSTGTPNSSVLSEATGEYGTGVGSQVAAQTASGGGYNSALAQQAVSSTDNAMQQQINQQYGSLQTSLADAGMSPDSSASALASSEFLSNASAAENQVASTQYTSMYQSSQQELTSLLETEMGQNNTDLNLTTAAADYLDYSSGTADLMTGAASMTKAIGGLLNP